MPLWFGRSRAPFGLHRPLFRPQAARRAVRLQVSRVDHHCLRNGRLRRQAVHHPGEDALLAPSLPAIVERLRRAILLGGIAPPQTIAIDEDYATQDATIIDPRLAMALGEEWLKTSHLRFREPEKVAHRSVSSRSLNHAETARSMGPEPRVTVLQPKPIPKIGDNRQRPSQSPPAENARNRTPSHLQTGDHAARQRPEWHSPHSAAQPGSPTRPAHASARR